MPIMWIENNHYKWQKRKFLETAKLVLLLKNKHLSWKETISNFIPDEIFDIPDDFFQDDDQISMTEASETLGVDHSIDMQQGSLT